MPADKPTPPGGENVSERSVEAELRREWAEVRLAFVSDDLLNPALVHGSSDIGLRERVEKAQEELEVIETVLSLNKDDGWKYRE